MLLVQIQIYLSLACLLGGRDIGDNPLFFMLRPLVGFGMHLLSDLG